VRKLNLRDLRAVTNAIFDHVIDDLKVDSVVVSDNKDFYWSVPSDGLCATTENQPVLDIGRLSDDWDFLQSILTEKDQAVALMLTHLAPLLRHVGEEVGQ
jgi:hypothetical protein